MTQPSASSTLFYDSETPSSLLFPDLESELATTRRALERVPDGQDDWRPHEKSRSLGDLATHIAQLPGFGIMMLTKDEFDAATARSQPTPSNNAERLKLFETVSAELRRQVDQLTWERARAPWTLRFGDRVALRAPRGNMVRSAMITHLAHHRAQLGVYLRMLDIAVPWSYGGTADEMPPPI